MKKQVKKAAPKKAAKKAAKKAVAKKSAPKAGKKSIKKAVKRAKKSVKSKVEKVVTTTTTVTTTTVTKNVVPKETHYLLILDESGSMSSVKKETLSGLNEQLKTIKNLESKYPEQDYFVSIVKFDDEIVSLLENVPSAKVRELTDEDYVPDAMTALHDAIGISVNKLKDRIQAKLKNSEAEAFVVILTDGAENASKEYSSDKIKNLITELEKTGLWTFTFIGANQNSVLTARNLGVNINNTVNYTSNGVGTTLAFASLSSAMGKRAMYRSAGVVFNDSCLSEVAGSNNIGLDANLLDLSGSISDADIQKAKAAALKNSADDNSSKA